MEQSNLQSNFLEIFVSSAQNLGFSFSNESLQKFCLYYEELCRWNRSINLTGLQTHEERTVLLFVDSLAGCLVLSDNPGAVIIDVGTGGGFPGIPLKLALPILRVFLLEPRANKTAFLHNVIGKLELTRISVIQSRLEHFHSMESDEEKCDVAFCKGVNVEHILPHLHHILKKNGKLVVFRSTNIDNHHFQRIPIIKKISYKLPFGYGNRFLLVLSPVSSTGQ